MKPIVFTKHARERVKKRGTTEGDVVMAIRGGYREPAQRGLFLYRLTLEYRREWDGGGDPMRITYDPEADALYIYLVEGARQCRVVRLTDAIALDFTEGEKLAGIEVLGASRLGITPDRPEVLLERIRGVIASAA